MGLSDRTDLLTFYAEYLARHGDPDVRAFLEAHPEASDEERVEVLRFDHDWRLAQGRRSRLAECLETFPTLAPSLAGLPLGPGIEATASLGTAATGTFGAAASAPRTAVDATATGGAVSVPGATWDFEQGRLGELEGGRSSVQVIESGERFAVRRLLGAGGMGVVYEAFDRKRSEVVALKIMRRADPTAFYQFKQEFRSLADLSHPNLLNLYELIAMADRLAFTMELVEGVDFLCHVRGEETGLAGPSGGTAPSGPTVVAPPELPPSSLAGREGRGLDAAQLDRLRHALVQLVAGINALHQAGKLHRDLKPSNVLVTRSGRVVILDFGLAIETGVGTGTAESDRMIVGTVAYMAPEQAAGRPVSPASDWYSVGVMLYEALTGLRPIAGRSTEILRRKQKVVPPPPSALAPGVPEDLDGLCRALLAIDPAERPSGVEIQSRLQAVPTGELTAAARAPAGIPLIGRARHRALLEAAFHDVARERRAVVVGAHGRSGVGKSALVQAFLDELTDRDAAVVLNGRCYERESVPYKALDSLIDALGRYLARRPHREVAELLPRDVHALARIFPVLRRVEAVAAAPGGSAQPLDRQELRRRAFGALRSLLKRLSAQRPLVLAIDDLQWGDVDSAALLAELLRPPSAPALLLIGSYRSEDLSTSPFLEKLRELREGERAIEDFRELQVEPLSAVEACELARVLLGPDQPSGAAETIARESGGNPFFIQELVQHVLHGDATVAAGEARTIDLDTVLWHRARRLPEGIRELLEVVAVSGRPIHQGDVLAATGLGVEGRAGLLALRTGRWVRFRGREEADEVETYHDRIRETVLTHLDEAQAALHHGRLAQALETSGRAGPDILATHYLGSGDHRRAAWHFSRAADQALDALAFEHAASLYGMALYLDPPGGAAERRLRTRMADALANAGRCFEAAQEYQQASEQAPPDEALELRRQATLHFLTSGHLVEGFAGLHDVLRRVKLFFPTTPRQVLATLLWNRFRLRLRGLRFQLRPEEAVPKAELARIDVCWSAAAGLGILDTIRASEFQARGLLLALKAGEPMRLVRNLAVEAAFCATTPGPSRRRVPALLRAASDLAKIVNHPYATGMVDFGAGLATYLEGNWKQSLDLVDRAEAVLRDRCTSVTWELNTTHLFALWSLTYLGEIAELQRRWHILMNEARERGDRFAVTGLGTYPMSIVRLAADDPETAIAELSGFEQLWDYPGFHLQHHGTVQGRVYAALYRGEASRAWELLQAAWPRYKESMLLRIQKARVDLLNLRSNSALAAAMRGHPEAPRLLRDAAACAARLEREALPWPRALAALVRAGLAACTGAESEAAAGFGRAAALFDACAMKLAAAVARRRQGEIVQGEEGRGLIEQATALMRQEQIVRPDRMALLYAAPIPERPVFRGAGGTLR